MESGEEITAKKVPKAARMNYREEIETIRRLPKAQRFVLIVKILGVFLFAIGSERLVVGQWIFGLSFIALGIFVSVLPLRIKMFVCPGCGRPKQKDQAICPHCGVPDM
jgi:rubrerythrin